MSMSYIFTVNMRGLCRPTVLALAAFSLRIAGVAASGAAQVVPEAAEVMADGSARLESTDRVALARPHDNAAAADLSLIRREQAQSGSLGTADSSSQATLEPADIQPLLEVAAPGPGAMTGAAGRASITSALYADILAPPPAVDGQTTNATIGKFMPDLQAELEKDGQLLGEHVYYHLRWKMAIAVSALLLFSVKLAVVCMVIPASRQRIELMVKEAGHSVEALVHSALYVGSAVAFLVTLIVVLERHRLVSATASLGEFDGKIINGYLGQVNAATMMNHMSLRNGSTTTWIIEAANPFNYEVSINELNTKVFANNKKVGEVKLQAPVQMSAMQVVLYKADMLAGPKMDPSAELGPLLKRGVSGTGSMAYDFTMKKTFGGSEYEIVATCNIPLQMSLFADTGASFNNFTTVQHSMLQGLLTLHAADLTIIEYERLQYTPAYPRTTFWIMLYAGLICPTTLISVLLCFLNSSSGKGTEGTPLVSAEGAAAPSAPETSSAPPPPEPAPAPAAPAVSPPAEPAANNAAKDDSDDEF